MLTLTLKLKKIRHDGRRVKLIDMKEKKRENNKVPNSATALNNLNAQFPAPALTFFFMGTPQLVYCE